MITLNNIVIYRTDRMNKNGIYIPHELLKESIKNMNRPVFGRLNPVYYGGDINLADVSHECTNFVVDDVKKEIRCDIKTMHTINGLEMEKCIYDLVPNAHCFGTVEHNCLCSHKLISVDMVTNND